MKRNSTFSYSILSVLFCLLVSKASAQTGSVNLIDGTGTLLNTYSGIEAAYAAIPATITQPYLIEFNSTYNGTSETLPITMSAKTGASIINSITIRPETGNTTSSINVNTTTAIFQLAGADYVIFDGRAGGAGNTINFEIINTNTASTTGYEMINGATNNVLKYVSVKRNVASSSACISVSNSLSGAANGCSYNLVEYCKTEGGGSGILLKGTSTGQSLFNTVRYCVVSNFFSKGIDGGGSINEVVVEGCTIYQSAAGNTIAVTGIALSSSTILGSFTVRNNIIRDLDAGTNGLVSGINLLHSAADTGYIYNNMISVTNNGLGVNGISASATSATNVLHVYHNTINIGGTSTASSSTAVATLGISKNTSTNTKWFVKNNIIINTRTGTGKHVALNITDSSGFTADYNCYTAPIFTRWLNATDYATLTDFKAVETHREIHSISKTVTFASTSDLHLSGGSAGDTELLGTFITDVTSDIDGELRSVTNPYMGADESASPLPVQLISFDAKKLEKQILLRWSTASENENSHFEIERSVNTLNFQNIDRVKGSGYSSFVVNYSAVDEQPRPGINYYRIKQVDLNGDFTYSKVIAVENIVDQSAILSVNAHTGRIEFYSTTDALAFIEIYDMQGRKIYAKDNWLINGSNTITFADHSLPTGVYILSVRNSTGFVITQKFLK